MAVNNKTKGWQNLPKDSFKSPLNNIEVFKKIIEAFPYPVAIFSREGTVVYINKAGFEAYKIKPTTAIGKYNFLQDPTMEAAMTFEKLKRAQKGETVFIPAVKVPLKELSARDGVEYEMEAVYMDITWFPVMEDGRVAYIVQHHVPCRVYKGKKEIEHAKEYIDNNWLEKFDLKKVVAASCLSPAHFTRLFRRYTGITAHEYYIRVKVGKLKEKLSDPHLSVTEAFAACNLDYNGYFARVFKAHTGLTPSEYKKQL